MLKEPVIRRLPAEAGAKDVPVMSAANGSQSHHLTVRENERRCIATGLTRPKAEMIRFVLGPEDAVFADIAGKLPGRGMWVTASRGAVETAVAKRRFHYAARRPVTVGPDLVVQLEDMLARRCCDILGLARRAGEMTAGFEKVKAVLAGGTAGCLITAADAAADGRDKLRRMAQSIPHVTELSGAELSLAIGRENVVHAALTRGKLNDRFLAEIKRLVGFRSSDPVVGSSELEQV